MPVQDESVADSGKGPYDGGVDFEQSLHRIQQEVVVLLHRVRRTTIEHARRIHAELQPAAFSLLVVVADREPVHASDLVELTGVDKGAVSRHIAHLEQLGLVGRSCDPEDRRAQLVVVTPQGRARLDALETESRSAFAARLSGWSDADLADFAERLARYNRSLGTPR